MYSSGVECFISHSIFQYLRKFDLVPVFTEEEFKHWFLPQSGIVDTYIVQDENNEITGK